MAESGAISWDADDRLAGDLRCVSCGYNLRGLARSGICGECGAPIKLSLAGSGLGFADPAWIGRLRTGTACLALTLPWLWFPPAWFAFGVGLWRITAPDPATTPSEKRLPITVLRLLLFAYPPIVWFCLLPLGAFLCYTHAASLNLDPARATLFLMAVALLSLLLITSAAVRRIVVREGSTRLRPWQDKAFWLGGLSLALVGAWGINEVAALQIDVLDVLGIAGALAGLAGFGFLLASLVGTWRILERAEAQARALRAEVHYWQRPAPGASHLSSASASDSGDGLTHAQASERAGQ